MQRTNGRAIGFPAALVVGLLLAASAAQAQTYSVTLIDNGFTQWDDTTANDLNDGGAVIGTYTRHNANQSATNWKAFLWVGGTYVDLTGNGSHSYGNAIGAGGLVGGWEGSGGTSSARLWGVFSPTYDFGPARGMGRGGNATYLVGDFSPNTGTAPYRRGFRYDKATGTYATLSVLANTNYAYVSDINAFSQIVGTTTLANGNIRAVRWEVNGTITNLGGYMPGPTTATGGTRAYALNDSGVIVGEVYHPTLGKWLAGTRTSTGSWTAVGGTAPLASAAYDINGNGHIVGKIQTSAKTYPFLFKNGIVTDLSLQVTNLPAGYKIESAVAINNSGQILCNGRYNGTITVPSHGVSFLLTPNP